MSLANSQAFSLEFTKAAAVPDEPLYTKPKVTKVYKQNQKYEQTFGGVIIRTERIQVRELFREVHVTPLTLAYSTQQYTGRMYPEVFIFNYNLPESVTLRLGGD